MEITLVNFRCYRHRVVFRFELGKLTLLKGQSGAGKSTILMAIYWCLYGTLRNIYNNENPKGKCYVKLKMPSMTICRQSHPNLLQVDDKYEDKVAQQIIEQRFGTKEVWRSCCYIDQHSR